MTVKFEAQAFAIWRYCEPRGWDVTQKELARGTGIHPLRVGRVLALKGWASRIRTRLKDVDAHGPCGKHKA
jgi:hypothetical protein